MIIIFHCSKIRRAMIIGLGIILILAGLTASLFQNLRIQGRLSRLTLLIDPGHGGVDGGAQDARGNLEKNINLAIGLKIREQLRESGINIIITRESDMELAPFLAGRTGRHRRDLNSRITKAKENNCLFLVSIHCDSSSDERRYGTYTFYNYLSNESKELALSIQTELNRLSRKSRKAAPGKYLVIREKGVTGVLIEVGFLSNHQEANRLQDDDYRNRLALAIAGGILKYCRNYALP